MSSAVGTPSTLRVWLLATRPATLTVAVSPVLVGAAAAWRSHPGAVRFDAVLAALLGAVFIQIGTNLANDVFDYEKGADTAERLGPVRVTQSGLLKPGQVRAGMVASFALATAAGAWLALSCGWPIVAIGVASIASGIAYTGGPYPLGYNGLGDVFVFVFFGLVAVCGTAFVAIGSVPWLAVAASVPVGALATAVLAVNNVRDHRTDVGAGKRTLVVRFGRGFGVAEYAGCWVASMVVPVVLAAALRAPTMLLPLVLAPVGVRLSMQVARTEGRALNPLLGRTALLLCAHSLLLAAGMIAGTRAG